AAQTEVHGRHRPDCLSCRGGCQVKDRRSRRVATLFGEVVVRIPRFTCAACKRIVTAIDWPQHTRSTPEQLQAHLSAMMTYRVAAGVLRHLLPVTAGAPRHCVVTPWRSARSSALAILPRRQPRLPPSQSAWT